MFNLRRVKYKDNTLNKNEFTTFYPILYMTQLTLEPHGCPDNSTMLTFGLSNIMSFICLLGSIIMSAPVWLSIIFGLSIFMIVSWGRIHIKIPIIKQKNINRNHIYGVYIRDLNSWSGNNIIICLGNNKKYINFPWVWTWFRISYKLDDGNWYNEMREDKKEFSKYSDSRVYGSPDWVVKNERKYEYDYIYTLDSGDVQETKAVVYLESKEWRRKIFNRLGIFSKDWRGIIVHFEEPIGEDVDTPKGGVYKKDFELKRNERVVECLRRMERDCKF